MSTPKSIPERLMHPIADELNFLECYTYNLVDGKVQKTKLKKEGIFKKSINSKILLWGKLKAVLRQ